MNIQLLQVVFEKQICEATHTAISEVGVFFLFSALVNYTYVCVLSHSVMSGFAASWTVAHQAPLPMEMSE